MPSSHWQLLASPPFNLLDNFSRVDDAIDANAEIADRILVIGLVSFGLLNACPAPANDYSKNKAAVCGPRSWENTASPGDIAKAHSTLRQFYRDWSRQGAHERDACYGPVIRDLEQLFGKRPVRGTRVLVPGSGLGRLVLELCLAGYDTEGNEISYHQLLASSWVLNHSSRAGEFNLYPFATQFSNLRSREQQLLRVSVPDVHPGTAMASARPSGEDGESLGSMSMTASDFLLLYGGEENRESFDVVATVFFIDTAPNIIRYIETVRNCLKKGGYWINVGPLLWHFEDGQSSAPVAPDDDDDEIGGSDNGKLGARRLDRDEGIAEPGRVELTDEEVVQLVERMGFTFLRHESLGDSGYIQDPQSMLQNLYRPSHWVVRKT